MEKPLLPCGRCGHNNPGPNHDCVIHLLHNYRTLSELIANKDEVINQLIAENANLKTLNSDLMSKMPVKEENKKWSEIVKSPENGNKDNEKVMAPLDKSKIEVTPPAEMPTLPTLHKVDSLNKRTFVIKSYLRGDQTIKDVGKKRYQDSSVRIVAQSWVKQGLQTLAKHLPKNTVIEINDSYEQKLVEPMSGELSLRVLQQMARNDGYNTNGLFNLSKYGPGIDISLVLSIKDLSRQCVVVGSDWTTGFGGYPKGMTQRFQKKKVLVCDLSGLQFQNRDNTGRLVVVGQQMPKGLLDDFIYENVVKQPKPSYVDAINDRTGRFIPHKDYFFDSEAYIRFVANDVLTCGRALDLCSDEEINFKFLKYGTGYFGGQFRDLLEKYIPEGVARGLEQLLPQTKKIKVIEFPFYEQNERLIDVCEKYGFDCAFSRDDALKQTHPRYVTATTNCSDPHSCAGNAMGFGSIDSSIAENLLGKAIKFSTFINKSMSEVLLDDL